jgi:tRNA pseudouridine55 synthase
MVDGFLVIDKPPGLTSHDVVSRIRRLAGGKRVGHTGTLDPFATGVLPIAVGEATKAIQFLDESVKEYQATLHLGEETDTYDNTGSTVAQFSLSSVTPDAVRSALEAFKGHILQVPPMYSAIKQGGKPLYRLARQGVTVERPPRAVTIYRLEASRIQLPEVELLVSCSPGTYIRSLAFDLGRALGCGAHLTALRRLRSGSFILEKAHDLQELATAVAGGEGLPLLPMETFLSHLRRVEMDEQTTQRVRNGIRPPLEILDAVFDLADPTPVLLTRGGVSVAAASLPARIGEGGETLSLLRVFCQDSALHSSSAMVETQS